MVIDDNVWIGCNVTILKGVHIHSGAVIGSGSVVTKDVDSGCVYAGKAATKIKEL